MPLLSYPELYFTTCTIKGKVHLLKDNKYKDIIVNSLHYLTNEKSVMIFAFVIMSNHVHIIWQIPEGYEFSKIRQRFLKFTAQKLKQKLQNEGEQEILEKFKSTRKDRKYQIWQDRSLSVGLNNDKIVLQKMSYLHENPVRASLTLRAEIYVYSSANFYTTGDDQWKFIENFWLS